MGHCCGIILYKDTNMYFPINLIHEYHIGLEEVQLSVRVGLGVLHDLKCAKCAKNSYEMCKIALAVVFGRFSAARV